MVESVIPDLVVEVVVTVSGVIISVGIPIILAKLNKFEKLYTTVFGIDNVETISGLVGAVESHENDLVNIKDQQEDIMIAQTEILKLYTENVSNLNNSHLDKREPKHSRDSKFINATVCVYVFVTRQYNSTFVDFSGTFIEHYPFVVMRFFNFRYAFTGCYFLL
jgi:preprotein translocase subunit YajC